MTMETAIVSLIAPTVCGLPHQHSSSANSPENLLFYIQSLSFQYFCNFDFSP